MEYYLYLPPTYLPLFNGLEKRDSNKAMKILMILSVVAWQPTIGIEELYEGALRIQKIWAEGKSRFKQELNAD